MYKIGTIVRYADKWCNSPDEKQYRHIVLENRLNPVTNQMTRYLIKTINMENMTFQPSEIVDEYMIELAD